MNDPRFLIGIDLGTTNSACAFVDLHEPDTPRPRLFRIPQVVAPGEVEARDTLPSFVYFPQDAESAGVVGEYAREQGALAPARQVSSAKSWLCHPAVDRTAPVLPWGADPPFVSPVEASTRILTHVRDAWNESMSAGKDEWRLERQPIVLTVPASFDEEARELTLEAARAAGLHQLTLVEEPLAAFYAWIESHPSALRARKRKVRAAPGRETKNGTPFTDADLVLVCDVGGGTSDFTLIRVGVADGELTFDRMAVGEHLLLGGDNLDLALARLLESTLDASSLSLVQRLALRRSAAAAKERLLADASTDRVAVTVLGSGRSVVGGALTTELTRDQVVGALLDGFLPLVDRDAAPVRDRHAALREMGLPYADDPAITRHLAAFLRGHILNLTPTAVLFNGGFFTPAIARERVLENLAHWYAGEEEWRPRVLENANPAAAVALGAAAYALARRGGGLRIHAGSARSYYIGLGGEDAGRAVCILPRGTEEGSSFSLADRAFAVMTNRPVSFPLFSSTTRADALGVIVAAADAGLHAHAPLSSVLRFGKKTRQVDLEVGLAAMYTETGTLQVECTSRSTDHRWRLQFFARESATTPRADKSDSDQAHAFVADERLTAARAALAGVFGETGAIPTITPEDLPGQLEATLGFGRQAWPVEVIRALADTLLTMAGGRRKGPRYEARWLNLLGFCLRPGFGAPLDDWRVNQTRSVYVEGLAFAVRPAVPGRVDRPVATGGGRAEGRPAARPVSALRDRARCPGGQAAAARERAGAARGLAPARQPRTAGCRRAGEAG